MLLSTSMKGVIINLKIAISYLPIIHIEKDFDYYSPYIVGKEHFILHLYLSTLPYSHIRIRPARFFNNFR